MFLTLPTFVSRKMRSQNNITEFKYSVGILLGVITAIAIVFSQSFYYTQDSTITKEIAKTADPTSDEDSSTQLTAGNDLLGLGGQFSISHIWHCTITIPFDDFRDFTSTCLKAVDYNTQFRTLFRTLISPNAP